MKEHMLRNRNFSFMFYRQDPIELLGQHLLCSRMWLVYELGGSAFYTGWPFPHHAADGAAVLDWSTGRSFQYKEAADHRTAASGRIDPDDSGCPFHRLFECGRDLDDHAGSNP